MHFTFIAIIIFLIFSTPLLSLRLLKFSFPHGVEIPFKLKKCCQLS